MHQGYGMNPPVKRNNANAFDNNAGQARPRPAVAAPAVPSFNASIEHLLPRKPPVSPTAEQQNMPRKQNILGLTPAAGPDSEPEDDAGEEERLAERVATTTTTTAAGLQFEYRGQTATLRTPAEIAAWIAERKRRYPTQAKAEAAKKEVEEKRKRWEEAQAAKQEARREAQARRDEERRVRHNKTQARQEEQTQTQTQMAESKADKLRKKAAKLERQLAKAEEALRLAQEKKQKRDSGVTAAGSVGSEHAAEDVAEDSDVTSSSGSSSSESESEDDDSMASDAASSTSNSAPEVLDTKKQSAVAHGFSAATPRPAVPPRVCKNLIKYGRCRFGAKCRFSHERPNNTKTKRGPSTSVTESANARRKGLWQVLVEKEEEEERKRLLETIITLGERGVLDDPTTTKVEG
jgi:hypothetical protein